MKKKEQIQNYIAGKMSEEELDNYTKQLVKEHYDKEAFKKNWHQQLTSQKQDKQPYPLSSNSKSRILLMSRLAGIAAIFLLVVTFSFGDTEKNNTLSSHLSTPYSSPIQYRSVDVIQSTSDTRQQAYNYYSQREYSEAAKLFKILTAENAFHEDDYFFHALSLLYDGKSSDAAQLFEKILQQDDLQRADAATWFLALSLIDSDQHETAKKYLIQISTWSGNKGRLKKAQEAKDLLNSIRTK